MKTQNWSVVELAMVLVGRLPLSPALKVSVSWGARTLQSAVPAAELVLVLWIPPSAVPKVGSLETFP